MGFAAPSTWRKEGWPAPQPPSLSFMMYKKTKQMLITIYVRKCCAQPASPPGNRNKWRAGEAEGAVGRGTGGREVSPSCGGGAGKTFVPCLHRGVSLCLSLA